MIYSIKEVNMEIDKFKNLIKESIKEVLVEEGLLEEAIRSAMKENTHYDPKQAMDLMKSIQEMQERSFNAREEDEKVESQESKKLYEENRDMADRHLKKMQGLREQMLNSIGKSSYSSLYNLEGVDLFEGTTPLSSGGAAGAAPTAQSPLSGVEPGDAGVSLDSFLGNKDLWKQLIKK
jgi:hypothetical protein